MISCYLKLRDRCETLISFENERGCISNIRIFNGNEWKLASPFYMQLVLLAGSNNKLEYFGKILTKNECDIEVKSRMNSNNIKGVENGKC